MLFWRGELMIRERRGFERIYDLTERVLPAGTDTRVPAPDELGRFIVRRALAALGVAGEKEIRDYIRIGDKNIVAGALKEMLAAAEIVRLGVEGQNGVFYALPSALEEASRFRAAAPRVRLLSPFDNLVISRSRLKERFDFDYTLECYVPKDKRRHGYFVLPILFGENIVGRLDPKADRKSKTFIVRRLAIEPGFLRSPTAWSPSSAGPSANWRASTAAKRSCWKMSGRKNSAPAEEDVGRQQVASTKP